MTDFEKRVRWILEKYSYVPKIALAEIMQEVRGLVPPPMVYQDGTPRDKDYESGWNDCHTEILKKLEGES